LQEQQQWLDRITVNEVLAELSKIAFADVQDLSDELPEEEPQGPIVGKEAREAFEAKAAKPESNRDFWRKVDKDPTLKGGNFTGASTCRIVYKDRMTGRQVVLGFSVTAKMAALKLLGWHLGLFKDKKGMVKKAHIILPGTDDYVPMDKRAV